MKENNRAKVHRRLLRRKVSRVISPKEETGYKPWPIYIIASGVVTILTRYISDQENKTVSLIKLLVGSALIVYGAYMLFHHRKQDRKDGAD